MADPSDATVSSRRQLTKLLWPRVRRHLPIVIGISALLVFLIGWVGFAIQYRQYREGAPAANPVPFDPTVPFFRASQLFLLNSGSEHDGDHATNPFLSLARVAVVCWFVMISAAVVVRYFNEFRTLPRRMTMKDHVIIAGLGEIGMQVLEGLRRESSRPRVVAIDINPANPFADHARKMGADVIIGDASRNDVLDHAHADRALTAYVVNGDDGVNVEVAASLADMMKQRKGDGRAQLHLHIEDGNLAVVLQRHAANLHDTANLDVRVFNVARNVASQLATTAIWRNAPRAEGEVAHFVIIGFGVMGQALALQLARLAHFPNLKRSRFTIADADKDKLARNFLARYPRFTTWTDTVLGIDEFRPEMDEWSNSAGPLPDGVRTNKQYAVEYAANARFVEMSPAAIDETFVRQLAADWVNKPVKPYIFVCGQEDRENFDAAITLGEKLLCFGLCHAPLFVWMPRQPALAEALRRDPTKTPSGERSITPFGECREAANLEEIKQPKREVLAETLHKYYEAFAVGRGEKEKASAWLDSNPYRDSNIQAAEHLMIKLAYLGYELHGRSEKSRGDLVEFDRLPLEPVKIVAEMEHNRWMAERLLSGWRFTERPGTNEEITSNKGLKLHHNLTPWEQVPQEDRERDFEQVRILLRACQNPPFRLERAAAPEAPISVQKE